VWEVSVLSKPTSKSNPYKVLYWMGAGLLLLFVGIFALVKLSPSQGPRERPAHERTLLWVYDRSQKAGPAIGIVIEESRQAGTLSAVAFPVPEAIRQTYATKGPRQAQTALQAELGRQLHHRIWLPYSVLGVLIDASGGVDVGGKRLSGEEAEAYITASGTDGSARGTAVLLGLVDGVARRGIELSAGKALSLANQIDTDYDLTAMPDVFGGWASYAQPKVTSVGSFDQAAISGALQPDPAPATQP
jgi:hypothetical protein